MDNLTKRKILSNKKFLYMTEFFSGMSLMAVELGASRLLAPYFSSSQIVWTIIIGTIMIALALGNIFGGRDADKHPDPDRLYRRIIVAAVWIGAIPLFGKYAIILISGLLIFTVNTGFLVVAAFVACAVVFVFPLFLLGTVTPSLVKYTTDSLEENGRIVGQLGAANTIGSIIGTFVPTFISIPTVGTSVTFFIFSGILLAITIVYFVSSKIPLRQVKRLPIGIAIFVVSCIFGHNASFAFWENDLTYEGESVYNYLQVYEGDSKIYLSTNVLFGVQSVYQKDGKLTGMYYDYAMASAYMAGVNENERSLNALILGMGTGTFATQCSRYFDNMEFTGVEIDDKITTLARTYFDLDEDIDVVTYDGRAYLNASEEKYDIIMVDAYQDITIPFQMSSAEFFSLVKSHLNENGVMVVNMNMRTGDAGSINEALTDTISSVFGSVYTVDVSSSSNRELFASDNPSFISRMNSNISSEDDEALHALMESVSANLEYREGGDNILTDDKAPVELLGMRAIDNIIRDEVAYYKEIYDEQGLSALMGML